MDEIIKIRKEIENKKSVVPYNTKIVLQELLDFIDKMCEENQPEYGYISNTYYCGKNHRWNVGDKLAYYEYEQMIEEINASNKEQEKRNKEEEQRYAAMQSSIPLGKEKQEWQAASGIGPCDHKAERPSLHARI